MKSKVFCFIVMLCAVFAVCGITAENKFQQYEQATVKPIDVNRLNFGYFTTPFVAFGSYRSGFYFYPYFDMMPEAQLLPVDYPKTTKVSEDDYGPSLLDRK